MARSLVRDIGAKSFSINASDKVLYHAAAVMASGHVTALFDIATEMLTRCGLEPKRSRAVLLPLLRSALENLYASDSAHALTGTFARADTSTVRRHLSALNSKKMTDALAVAADAEGMLPALDDALTRLEQIDAEQARIVELRYFAGLSIEETADALGISPATLKRRWAMARAWLFRELSGSVS